MKNDGFIYRSSEVQNALGVTVRTMEKILADGLLPYRQYFKGGTKFFRESDVMALRKKHTYNLTEEL